MHLERRRNSRLERALSVSTMRFWRCHSRHERFSSRWPCSRKLATFVQTCGEGRGGRIRTWGRVEGGWGERHTFHVFVRESTSPKLLKGTKDLFPCRQVSHRREKSTVGECGAWDGTARYQL